MAKNQDWRRSAWLTNRRKTPLAEIRRIRPCAATFREDPLPDRPMRKRLDSRGRPISLLKFSWDE